MLYALLGLGGLCLALIVAIPVSLHIVMRRLQDMQLVQGTPAHLVERKQEIVRDQVKEVAERRRSNMPRLADKVGF
jgi:hypothetical protein